MREIFKKRPDIKKEVDEKYPKTKKESTCRSEMQKANEKRLLLAKRLYQHPET